MAATLNGSPFEAMTSRLFMPIEMVEKLRLLVEAHPTSRTAAIAVISIRFIFVGVLLGIFFWREGVERAFLN
jgi:hypothetical protein